MYENIPEIMTVKECSVTSLTMSQIKYTVIDLLRTYAKKLKK